MAPGDAGRRAGAGQNGPAPTADAQGAAASAQNAAAAGAYAERVRGCLLGAMSGDALGAPVEGEDAAAVRARFPNGLTTMLDGSYTDDFEMTFALASSLVSAGRLDAFDAAQTYARMYTPYRGYAPGARTALAELVYGADPRGTGRSRMPDGSWGNGGAMRIAPVGLAYRNAPPEALARAVEGALLPTHVHPEGIDGALMQAAAVGWLARVEPGCLPLSLLERVEGAARTPRAAQRLGVLRRAAEAGLPCCVRRGPVNWKQHLESPEWLQGELAIAAEVAPGFQINAVDAAAAAIWAVICHLDSPLDAVVAAAHFGGDTDTIACMAGAMAGALHGAGWLPEQWWRALENGPDAPGRDEAVRVAARLVALDCREAPEPWEGAPWPRPAQQQDGAGAGAGEGEAGGAGAEPGQAGWAGGGASG